MKIFPITELPTLCKRLGKHKINRIHYHSIASTRRQVGAKNLKNTVINMMQLRQPYHQDEIADLIVGAARNFSHGDKSLSIEALYMIFQCIEVLNTREIIKLLRISDRQARFYMRAVKHLLPLLEKQENTPVITR